MCGSSSYWFLVITNEHLLCGAQDGDSKVLEVLPHRELSYDASAPLLKADRVKTVKILKRLRISHFISFPRTLGNW